MPPKKAVLSLTKEEHDIVDLYAEANPLWNKSTAESQLVQSPPGWTTRLKELEKQIGIHFTAKGKKIRTMSVEQFVSLWLIPWAATSATPMAEPDHRVAIAASAPAPTPFQLALANRKFGLPAVAPPGHAVPDPSARPSSLSYVTGLLGSFAILTNKNEFHLWCLPLDNINPTVKAEDGGKQVLVTYNFPALRFKDERTFESCFSDQYVRAGAADITFKAFEFTLAVPLGHQLVGAAAALYHPSYVGMAWYTNRSERVISTGVITMKRPRAGDNAQRDHEREQDEGREPSLSKHHRAEPPTPRR